MKWRVWFALLAVLLLAGCAEKAVENQNTEPAVTEQVTQATTEPTTVPTEAPEERYLFTFAGDCTLGGHTAHTRAGYGFLMTVADQYDYPMANVRTWFENDDFTMVNLECALTDKGRAAGQRYSFRGPTSNVKILTENSIEAVSIANNHAYDYGPSGYESTKAVLEENGVAYVEQNDSTIVTLDGGLSVGIYGTVYNTIDTMATVEDIKALKEQVDLVIYAPHWGTENSFKPTKKQKELGRAVIEAGADIVYGCHPHVLQPIEEYQDGVIYYSLGNFCFGGNIYPKDYDSAIIQQEVIRKPDGTVSLGERTIIPCNVSSMKKRNNFQPTPYEEGTKEYERALSKLNGTYKGSNLPVG